MSNITYRSADQPTVTRALTALKGFKNEIGCLQYTRYGISPALKPEAAVVIERALAYCAELAEEIGADTFLGSCGTPATWAKEFTRELSNLS